MRRLAIFVEGRTELLFIDRLIREVAERSQIAVHQRSIRGGGKSGSPRKYIEIQTPVLGNDESFYVLIVDCGGDHLVAQRVREEHQSLTNNGYDAVIGLRDVFPDFTKADVPRLRTMMRYGVRTKLIPVHFFLAVMEIEAWFLSEHNHFPLVDPAITVDAIHTNLGFNPELDDMSARLEAASDLNDAYQIGAKSYVKGDGRGTVDKLSYDYIYLSLRDRIPDLQGLLSVVDAFLGPPKGDAPVA